MSHSKPIGCSPAVEIAAIAEALDPKDWSVAPAQLQAILKGIAEARDIDDIARLGRGSALARNPAFLEQLSLAGCDAENFRGVVRILWMYAEVVASKEPPRSMRSAWRKLCKLQKKPVQALGKPDLDRAIEFGVGLAEHPDFDKGEEYFKIGVLSWTGEALLHRSQSDEALDDLDKAAHFLSEASSLSRTGSPSFTRATTYGGLALLNKYALSHEPRDLETAILVLRYAVANHENHLPPLISQSGLGLVRAYISQYRLNGNTEELQLAVEVFGCTLAWIEEEDTDRAAVLIGELCECLVTTDHVEALVSVAGSIEQLIDSMPALRYRPLLVIQLCQILNGIYERRGNLAILNRSIACLSNSVAAGGPVLPMCLDALGIALKMRHKATHDEGDIERAVETHRRAVESEATDAPYYPMLLDHYSHALRNSFDVTHDPARLDKAVELAERAFSLIPEGTPDADITRGNLVNNLLKRGSCLERPEDLDRALSLCGEALSQPMAESERRHLLGSRVNLLIARLKLSHDESDIAAATAAWREYSKLPDDPQARFHTASNWCRTLFAIKRFSQVVEGFDVAKVAARDLVFNIETSEEGKSGWLRDFQWLVVMVAYALARCERPVDAVCEIEAGMALLLQESSWTRATDAG